MSSDTQERRPATRQLPDDADTLAPDGAEVRILCSLAGGSAAHFRLAPGAVSRAGRHRTVEEVWYIVDGEGEMWRRTGAQEDVVTLTPGLCLTIPLGTSFQFRAGHGHSTFSLRSDHATMATGLNERVDRSRIPLVGTPDRSACRMAPAPGSPP